MFTSRVWLATVQFHAAPRLKAYRPGRFQLNFAPLTRWQAGGRHPVSGSFPYPLSPFNCLWRFATVEFHPLPLFLHPQPSKGLRRG